MPEVWCAVFFRKLQSQSLPLGMVECLPVVFASLKLEYTVQVLTEYSNFRELMNVRVCMYSYIMRPENCMGYIIHKTIFVKNFILPTTSFPKFSI